MSNTEALRTAAQAVLDRWDSPQWEWTKHGPTADLMHALRLALAQPAATGGSPEHLLQDQNRDLSRALAGKPGARLHATEAAADIDEAHLARLSERGAVAWAGVDAADLRAGGDGMPDASVADVLLQAIQRLNQNPYSLTKSECIAELQAMRDLAGCKALLARIDALDQQPAASGEPVAHVPAGPEAEAATDAKLGLVLLPPIRVDRATHAALQELARARGLIVQAIVRERLAPYAVPDATAQPAPAPAVPPELDVRRIMIDIVPGDGSGHEVYAKTVADVEALLTTMGQRIEDLESAQPAPALVPLTEAQIKAMKDAAADQGLTGIAPSLHLARAVEAWHGIGTPAKEAP